MKVKVCCGKTCKSRFSEYITLRMENDKEKFELEDLEIEKVPCIGKCKSGPNIYLDDELQTNQNPLKTSELVSKKYKKGK